MTTGWDGLRRELDSWSELGRRARIWCRDDDAIEPTAALDRLLSIHAMHAVPLALAVIPQRVKASLADRLARERGVVAFQHGWGHWNHAPLGAAKAEFGAHRPVAYMLGELARGWVALDHALGENGWRHVFVPPHNRIADELRAALTTAGYRGLSAGLGPRGTPLRGLAEVNAHIDIMNWTTRAFAGEETVLAAMVEALATRRTGRVDAEEPIGYLTHHLAHDEAAWRFCDALHARLRDHRAVAFVDPQELFA